MDTKARLIRCFKEAITTLEEKDVCTCTQENCEGWDSLVSVQISMNVEDEFNITIGREILERLKSFEDYEKYINSID